MQTDKQATQKATLALMLAQSAASMGFLSMTTINAIVASRMAGTDKVGGIPTALVLIGAAVSAYVVGQLTTKLGRRNVLLLGCLLGMIGALVAGVGIVMNAILVFFVGLFIVGNGRGALDQGRYAAAEINPPDKRASAVSRVVWGGTVGAVIGPLLVNPSGQFITTLGLPFDSGAAFATAVLMAVAGLLIGVLLIGVDFKGIASRISISTSKRATDDTTYVTTTKGNPILHSPIPRAAMITMACAQAAMALMMAVISLHMKNHGHEGDVGVVITAHVLGMFAFSPIIGKLADRFGRQTMIMVGVGTLGLGCIFCPMFLNTPWIMWSEFLVGLGWSMCYVSSSAMLTNSLAPTVRARTQGTTDLFVNVASGIGSLSSGLLLATFDFVFVSVVGLIITLLPLLALFNMRSATPRTANT